jgi:acetyltransferase
VISAGFAEAGEAGAALQDRLSAVSRDFAFPVAGPNCIGYLNGYRTTAAGFMNASAGRPIPGSVALISQSGGFGSFLLQKSLSAKVRVGFFASTGNEADVSVARVMRHVVEWPQVEVLMLFPEAVRDANTFVAAADRAADLGKVVVAVRPDPSEAVQRAVRSHTASAVGASAVFDSVCDQHGVLIAESFDEMLDYALLMQDGRRMTSNRLGLITVSGGAGVMMAGAATRAGLDVPELPAEVQADIAGLVPQFAGISNPVDVTAALGGSGYPAQNMADVATTILSDGGVDALVAVLFDGAGATADAVRAVYDNQVKPMAAVIGLDPNAESISRLPVYADPVRAVRAMGALARISLRRPTGTPDFVANAKRRSSAFEILDRAGAAGLLDDHGATSLLRLYGAPLDDVDGRERASAGPVEIRLGIERDETFGALVTLEGGALGALRGSRVILRAPFADSAARSALARLDGGSIADPDVFGEPGLSPLVETLVALGSMGLELPSLGRLEITLAQVEPVGLLALDARIIRTARDVAGSLPSKP